MRARTARGQVEIEVTDKGPGIPEAERARATDRFYRGEAARSTPGSGLGLALVQAVAHLHGGQLTLLDAAPGLRAVLCLARGEDVMDHGAGPGQGANPPGRETMGRDP